MTPTVRQLLDRGELVAAARREAVACDRDGYDVTAELLRQLAAVVEGKSHDSEQVEPKVEPEAAPNPKLVLHINRARFAGYGVKSKMTAAELRRLPVPVIPDDHDLFRVVPGHEDEIVGPDEVLDIASFNGGLRLFSTPRFINAG